MITLTVIIIGKFINGLLHNKPAGVRLGGSDILTNLLGLKVLARIAKQGLLKFI